MPILTVGLEPHGHTTHTGQPGLYIRGAGAREALAGPQELGLREGDPQRRSTKDGCYLVSGLFLPPAHAASGYD